jgi:hypothetical protein
MKNISSFTVIRLVILGWSATLLTLNYMDYLKKMDATFIASVFTSALATFGVDAANKKSKSSLDESVNSNTSRSRGSNKST